MNPGRGSPSRFSRAPGIKISPNIENLKKNGINTLLLLLVLPSPPSRLSLKITSLEKAVLREGLSFYFFQRIQHKLELLSELWFPRKKRDKGFMRVFSSEVRAGDGESGREERQAERRGCCAPMGRFKERQLAAQGDAPPGPQRGPQTARNSCPRAVSGRTGPGSHQLLSLPWSELLHALGCTA